MTLPAPPIDPMLATPVGESIPQPGTVSFAYEPKWDGFRCIIFKSGDTIVVQGRSGDDLAYCFPEIVDAALLEVPGDVVLDGELVVPIEGRLDFDSLTQRIRPRKEAGGASIADLARRLPTHFLAFDLLGADGRSLMDEPFSARRTALEALLDGVDTPFHLTPMTLDPEQAAVWFREFEGAGLDGIIAKPLDAPYAPGKRTMLKVKHARTADVVVAGWRAHKTPAADGTPVVGSLLLGLYDDDRVLHHVGVASSFNAATRRSLVEVLAPYAVNDGDAHPWTTPSDGQRIPGGQSRWSGKKDLSFTALRPHLVAEVGYDQMQGDRFRHVASFTRWRPDRLASTCTYAQLERPVQMDVMEILSR